MVLAPGSVLRSNCPRDCYDSCAIRIENREGTLVVRGDDEHPTTRGALCGKCTQAYNGIWQDPQARLLYPAERVGPKGSGQFRRISWERALERIAQELWRVVQTQGPEAIVNLHYSGTLSMLAFFFPMRFFNRLGATEVDPDSICNAAGHVAWNLLYGESSVGFDTRTIDASRCVLVWGANPAHTAPHHHTHWLRSSGAQVIVVDPLRTAAAADADIHLQPRPGTDAALAFGLLHVLRRDGHFDAEFIGAATTGLDEIEALIESATPQRTETLTGVPVERLEAAAAAYGPGPSLLWAGQGLTRQPRGGNIMRAVGLLPAVTGNVGKPGAGFCYLNITPAVAGLDFGGLMGVPLQKLGVPGSENVGVRESAPRPISHVDLADHLADVARSSALVCWNMNPVASAPRQAELRRALLRDDLFTVAIDLFPTDTADYADIVLPAASMFEFDDLTFSYFALTLGVQSKVREPLGEALPNQEIFRRLAAAMGLTEPELFETDEVLIARMLDQMGIEGGFSALQERGWTWALPDTQLFYADRKFPTPSGRIEIASERAERRGLPRTPLPDVDPPLPPGHLRMLTPASNWRINASYGNVQRGHVEKPAALLHAEDAARLDVAAGDRVRLTSPTESVELAVEISSVPPPGIVVVYKGMWPKHTGGVSVNALNPGLRTDMGNANAVHGVTVAVSRV